MWYTEYILLIFWEIFDLLFAYSVNGVTQLLLKEETEKLLSLAI